MKYWLPLLCLSIITCTPKTGSNYSDTFVIKMSEISKTKPNSYFFKPSVERSYQIKDMIKFMSMDRFPCEYGSSNLDIEPSLIKSSTKQENSIKYTVNNYIMLKRENNAKRDFEINIANDQVKVDSEIVMIKDLSLGKEWTTYRIVDNVNLKLKSRVTYIDRGLIITVQDIIDNSNNIIVPDYSEIMFLDGFGIISFHYNYLRNNMNRLYTGGQIIMNRDPYVSKRFAEYTGQTDSGA